MINKNSLSYKDAGVNIETSNKLISLIKNIVKKTHRSEVIDVLGGFSSLCELPKKYKEPVLVFGTDGVGTKLRLAVNLKRHNTIGIDLVAMCVNDLIVKGAEPLFFLDYYATSKLDINTTTDIIQGIVEGCLQSGCALVGGEIAEMPGIYRDKDYDLVGFCIGVAEKSEVININKVVDGDVLIALSSSGLHSNGYSLVRKIIDTKGYDPESIQIDGRSFADHLLEPTSIYVKNILALIKHVDVHAIAHITGGGFWKNIPRILPNNTQAVIDKSSWHWPTIFSWLQNAGNISQHEMYHTFNCGVGMIVVLPANEENKALSFLRVNGEKAFKIGVIKASISKYPEHPIVIK